MTTEPIDTSNWQMVGTSLTNTSGSVSVMMPKPMMTADEALLHAAWLVALAEPFAGHDFVDVLEAVRNT